MNEKISHDAKIYTDMEGLEKLRYQSKSDPQSAKKEVARQFEALLMQILLRSMREANKPLQSDLFGGDQMELYQDILDKQMTLIMSESSTGVAAMIEKNLDQQQFRSDKSSSSQQTHTLANIKSNDETTNSATAINDKSKITPATQASEKTSFNNQQEFVEKLWSSAKNAANALGVDPKILLAQAALETNWGKKVVTSGDNDTTHNLFNIKADASWKKDTTVMDTLEHKNGVLVKEKASFRSYTSFNDSFMDYVHFLKNNGRYEQALNKASDPKQFVQALQQAGFATDSNYADKIFSIFSSSSFNNLVKKMQ